MPETPSEILAAKQRHREWWKKFLIVVVPTILIFIVLIMVFFDGPGATFGIWFVVIGGLVLVFTIGAGKQRTYRSVRKSYADPGRFSGNRGGGGIARTSAKPPGFSSSESFGNAASSFGSSPGGGSGGRPSPYTTKEGYDQLVRDLHNDLPMYAPTGKNAGDKNNQQSQLGAKMPNWVLLVLLIGAALFLLFFA